MLSIGDEFEEKEVPTHSSSGKRERKREREREREREAGVLIVTFAPLAITMHANIYSCMVTYYLVCTAQAWNGV
jgi:hypothetical protein